MKFSIYFKVTAICNKYEKGDDGKLLESNIPIELTLDKFLAGNFLFRFARNLFDINDYRVAMIYKENEFKAITLFKDDHIYVVKNINSLLAQILEGFVRTRTTEKFSAMMEFDFESANNKEVDNPDEEMIQDDIEEDLTNMNEYQLTIYDISKYLKSGDFEDLYAPNYPLFTKNILDSCESDKSRENIDKICTKILDLYEDLVKEGTIPDSYQDTFLEKMETALITSKAMNDVLSGN